MATSTPPATERVDLGGNKDDSNTPILSRGILFTTHFAFGILALVGCLVIQCLLVTWFALLAAQVKSMNLQARMFEYVYGLSIEKAQAERKKRKNVVRIEITPPPGTNGQKPQVIKKEISLDEHISLNIRRAAPEVPPSVKDPLPVKLEVPTPKAPLSADNPVSHLSQPFEPKLRAAQIAIAAPPTQPTPKAALPVSNPNWQTKSVQERKTGGSRGYAVKQVDVFTPANERQAEPCFAPPPENDEQHEPFLAPTLKKNDERFYSFLEPAAMNPATREPFLGQPPATTGATSSFGPPVSSEQRVTMPSIPTQLHATLATAGATASFGFGPPVSSGQRVTMPSFPTHLHATQKSTPISRPVVKLPGMSSSLGSWSNAPKRQFDLQSPALEKEQHPVASPQKRVRKSMIKLVQPETPLQMLLVSLEPQPKTNDNLVNGEVEEQPKLAAPIEKAKTDFIQLVPHAVTAAQPKVSRVISNISSASAEPTMSTVVEPVNTRQLQHKSMVCMFLNSPKSQPAPAVEVANLKMSQDTTARSSSGPETSNSSTDRPVNTNVGVDLAPKSSIFDRINNIASASARSIVSSDIEPANMDQLRHKFLDTSVLKKTPVQKPQQKPLPVIHQKPLPVFRPTNPEEVAREALIIAFHERESIRVELSRNYSEECVERFSQKAEEYKVRREALASLMPSGNLSLEDEASFPHLSTTDTNVPMVPSPTVSETPRPFPLPSPPTSGDESLEDQGKLGEMKEKYSSELSMLNDMFPDWTDVDLVFALDGLNGDLPRTIDHIMDGNVSQFAEVKKFKNSARPKAADGFSTAGAADNHAFAARGGSGILGEEHNEQRTLHEEPRPLLRNASKAYQVLLQATKNMEGECPDCNSKFCLNSYSPAGQRKMKSARDLYQKSRSRLMGTYESGQLPVTLASQYPEVESC